MPQRIVERFLDDAEGGDLGQSPKASKASPNSRTKATGRMPALPECGQILDRPAQPEFGQPDRAQPVDDGADMLLRLADRLADRTECRNRIRRIGRDHAFGGCGVDADGQQQRPDIIVQVTCEILALGLLGREQLTVES